MAGGWGGTAGKSATGCGFVGTANETKPRTGAGFGRIV